MDAGKCLELHGTDVGIGWLWDNLVAHSKSQTADAKFDLNQTPNSGVDYTICIFLTFLNKKLT